MEYHPDCLPDPFRRLRAGMTVRPVRLNPISSEFAPEFRNSGRTSSRRHRRHIISAMSNGPKLPIVGLRSGMSAASELSLNPFDRVPPVEIGPPLPEMVLRTRGVGLQTHADDRVIG